MQELLDDEAIAASAAEDEHVAEMALTYDKYSRILTFDFSYAKAKVSTDPCRPLTLHAVSPLPERCRAFPDQPSPADPAFPRLVAYAGRGLDMPQVSTI